MEETEISIEEVEVWVVPEEDVKEYLEQQENIEENNVNREQEEKESE